jgi:CheY-like chemotaxis protein
VLEGAYIIVITGLEGDVPRLESLLAGADDFLRKPVLKDDLLHRVELGAKARELRRELLELRAKDARSAQTQDILAAGLDMALQGLEDALGRLNTGDAIAAMNRMRAAHDSVRAALSKIVLPEG